MARTKQTARKSKSPKFDKKVKAVLAVFFARLDLDGDDTVVKVTPAANLSPTFESLLQTATNTTRLHAEFSRHLCTAVSAENLTASDSTLKRLVQPTFKFNITLFSAFINGMILSKNLNIYSQHKTLVHQTEVSLLAFGQQDIDSEETKKRKRDDVDAETDEKKNPYTQDSAGKKKKINPVSSHIDTCLNDVLIAIANFIAFCQVIIDCSWSISPDNPTIINWLLELANVVSSPDTIALLEKNAIEKPYIFHTVFLNCQDLLAKFGGIIRSTNAVKMFQDNEPVPPILYQPAFSFFLATKKDIDNFTNGTGLQGHFAFSEPPSYRVFGSGIRSSAAVSSAPKDKGKSNKNHGHGGWLTVTPGNDPSVIQEVESESSAD